MLIVLGFLSPLFIFIFLLLLHPIFALAFLFHRFFSLISVVMTSHILFHIYQLIYLSIPLCCMFILTALKPSWDAYLLTKFITDILGKVSFGVRYLCTCYAKSLSYAILHICLILSLITKLQNIESKQRPSWRQRMLAVVAWS